MTNIYTLLLSLLFVQDAAFINSTKIPTSKFLDSKTRSIDTGWESVSTWKELTLEDNKLFYSQRSIPELTNEVLEKGLVLVFAKGYPFMADNSNDKAIPLPALFFSEEGTDLSYKWIINKKNGSVEIGIKTPIQVANQFSIEQSKLQFRYFVLDASFLRKNNFDKQLLQNMNYQQLVKTLNSTP